MHGWMDRMMDDFKSTGIKLAAVQLPVTTPMSVIGSGKSAPLTV